MDAVVLTAKAGETTKGELAEVLTVLRQVGANIVGVVLIGVSETESYGKQYYYRSDNYTAPSPDSAGMAAQSLWDTDNGTKEKIDLTPSASNGGQARVQS